MSIDVAEKILRAKADYDAVYEAGMASGGGEDPIEAFVQGTTEGEYVSDKVTSLRLGAFSGCGNLTKISLPNCTEILGRYAFNECKNVTEINLPSLTSISDGNYTFYGMTSLEKIKLPNLTTVGSFSATFWNCTNAKRIEMPKLSGQAITTYVFRYCYAFETLILGGETMNTLSNTNAFQNAGRDAPSGLSIYVPNNLVNAYKGATNWATYANQIKPMSEAPEE